MKNLKNWTLQFASVLLLLGASVGLTSCDDETLSASKAKSLLKKEISRLNQEKAGIEITTGYYECNDDEARYKLRQLVANQLIDYKCERVMKPETVKKTRRVRDGWGFTYNKTYYETDIVPTYFVTVALTEKGKKLLWEEKEVKPTKDEEEMKADLELDSSKFPEGSVKEVEFPETDAETGATAAADAEGDGVMDDISEEDYDAMAADEKRSEERIRPGQDEGGEGGREIVGLWHKGCEGEKHPDLR